MKRRICVIFLALCLLLSGCSSWMDGSYAVVKPHMEQGYREEYGVTEVLGYQDIRNALVDMVANGVESGMLSVQNFREGRVDHQIDKAIGYVKRSDPVGSYAVNDITYEVGTVGGAATVAVNFTYIHSRSEIQNIKHVTGMEAAEKLIHSALDQCAASLVMKIGDYKKIDYVQLVQDYAQFRPDMVMELPQVTATVYPNVGDIRVVEIQFAYQTSRESLRSMQTYVQPVFSSAALYVSGDADSSVKYAQLYSFLMERNEYQIGTSITPSYSMLRHGVGDSKAFATVYAAMCYRAKLECYVVSGTKDGAPRFWNIICQGDTYYHVDLLQSHQLGVYQAATDDQMQGYVWDYSAYPECKAPQTEETGST